MTAPLALGIFMAFLGAGLPVLRAQEPLTPLLCPLCAPSGDPRAGSHLQPGTGLCWSCQKYPELGTARSGYHICPPQHRSCSATRYLSMQGRSSGNSLLPKIRSCSSSCPRAPRDWVPAGAGRWGWSGDAPAPSCTSLCCPVTRPCWGLVLWGQHVPVPMGIPALQPLHPRAGQRVGRD